VKRLAFAFLLTSAALWPAGPARLDPLDEAGFRQLLAASKGKVLLVNFWATWCAPCREEMPLLVKLEAAYRARGFRLVTVSADEPEDARQALEFLQKVGVPQPAYIKRAANDDKFITAVDAKWSGALPALFLYDKSGRKVRSFIGEADFKLLETEIRKLL
jgi:thiol-disulfide isomerase/thioredoxin